ncbi:MAG: DegV family protein [Defluviitaleaceae bacterium]|nr:DegV family protein [Defluviitaleaceae bacterium]
MVQIVADSACDFTREIIEREGCAVSYVPINIQLEDRFFADDGSLDVEMFLRQTEASTAAVKTAAPSPERFVDQYKKGDSVFVVTLSSGISATYQAAMTAKQMYFDEFGKKFIHVFDTLSASAGEGLVAQKIAQAVAKGLSNLEIVTLVESFIASMRTYFMLDRFDSLVKSGRINPYVAKLASLLNIKPICGGVGGKLSMLDKARGYSKAVAKLIETIKRDVPDPENRVVGISHAKCFEKAVALKNELIKNLRVKDVIITEVGGVIASYANRGGYVVAL